MASGDLIANIFLRALRPYVSDRDMRLVWMGQFREVHDRPKLLMERMQLRGLNRCDHDDNLSGRRGREGRGRAEGDGKGSLRHQLGLDRGDVVPLNPVAQGDVGRPDVPAPTGKVLLSDLALH